MTTLLTGRPKPALAACSNDEVNAAGPPEQGQQPDRHPGEPHGAGFGARLNWLRAGVLGANDGIVSVAGLVVGVAGVTTERGPLFTAGIAGLVAGAVSMALGEYVSVSSQRDSEKAQLATEKRELREDPNPSSPSSPRSMRRRAYGQRRRARSPAS